MANELFTREGQLFTGSVLTNDKGKPYYAYQGKCHRCGGAGGGDRWAYTGWTCYRCGGSGTEAITQRPLYTADKLAKLNASADKRNAAKRAKVEEAARQRQAAIDARRVEFNIQYGPLLARCDLVIAAEIAVARGKADGTIIDEEYFEYSRPKSFVEQIVTKAHETCTLTENQANALINACNRFDAQQQCGVTSNYVGIIGDTIELPVKVLRLGSYPRTPYGSYNRDAEETVWIVTMEDEAGNHIVSKSPNFKAEVGELFQLRAKIKEHNEYKGVKQTVVNYAKVK